MEIKVFNRETAQVEIIDSSKLDVKIHCHRNTFEDFSKEELESFWLTSKSWNKKTK